MKDRVRFDVSVLTSHRMPAYSIAEYEAILETVEERARLAHLRADISDAFSRRRELDEVLQACTEALVKQLDAAFARIWVLDKAGEVLELRAGAGLYTHLNGAHGRVKVGDFKIGRIAKNLQPHISNSVTTDPEVSDPEWARRENMISFAGYPLILEGKALGVVALFARHPLSESVINELKPVADGIAQWIKRKQSEQALGDAQKQLQLHASQLEQRVEERTISLKKTVAELEAFSYSLSHDMRAPLRAVQSYLQFFVEDYGAKIDEAGLAVLQKVIGAAQRMDRMVLDLLTFTRLSHEEMSIEPVDVEWLIRQIVKEQQELGAAKSEIVVRSPLSKVMGNPASLRQCLINLVGNAVKFVAPGVVPHLQIYSEGAGPTVRIWIEDNGIGIDQEEKRRLFRMFERLHGNDYPGTGIGLAIVRKAAERMDGCAGVESEVGKGSRFWLDLPGVAK
jgi:signal transduction histidine kinase